MAITLKDWMLQAACTELRILPQPPEHDRPGTHVVLGDDFVIARLNAERFPAPNWTDWCVLSGLTIWFELKFGDGFYRNKVERVYAHDYVREQIEAKFRDHLGVAS